MSDTKWLGKLELGRRIDSRLEQYSASLRAYPIPAGCGTCFPNFELVA